jgi:hypothetical protein
VAVSALDASTAQVLRAKLAALAGVEHTLLDEATLNIFMHCEPDCTASVLRKNVHATLCELGIEPESATLHFLTDLAARQRVKFIGVERVNERDGNVRMRVTLGWNGELKQGSAVNEAGELIELRTAAAAALDALEQVRGESLGIKLVGVKQLRAFDVELMVVALYRNGTTPQRFVGAVPVGGDTRRAAAVAVLNALNRILGNYLTVNE